jgi:type IV secretory pathway TrbL component
LLFLNGAAGLKKDMKSELMQRVIGYVLFSIVFYNQFAISGWVMNLFASFGISLGEGSFSFHTKLPSISGIVGRAFDLWGHEMTMWTEMNGIERITDGLMILIGFLATLFAFGYAAVHYTIALVEWQIVLIGVRVLLPLSLWDQTRSIALNAGKAIFTHAFKMMVLFFVIGVGEWLVPGELLAGLASFERIGAVVVLSFIYLTLVISVPQLAQSILSGNPGLTGGSMGQALSSVANTMRIARGATNMAMRAAGAAGAAAQAGMSGGMKAITRMSSIASAGSAAASETMRKTGSQSAAKAAGQKARQAMRQNMNQKLKADVGRALGGAASKMMFGNHFGGGKALGANTAFSKITADRSSTGFQHLGASIKAAGTVGKGFARAGADAARKASANVGKAGRGA